jgi:hypothetical protein
MIHWGLGRVVRRAIAMSMTGALVLRDVWAALRIAAPVIAATLQFQGNRGANPSTIWRSASIVIQAIFAAAASAPRTGAWLPVKPAVKRNHQARANATTRQPTNVVADNLTKKATVWNAKMENGCTSATQARAAATVSAMTGRPRNVVTILFGEVNIYAAIMKPVVKANAVLRVRPAVILVLQVEHVITLPLKSVALESLEVLTL